MTAYGIIINFENQFFRTYDTGFNTKTFIWHVTEMRRLFGKINVILDRASPHRSKYLRQKFGRDGDVRFVYLPRGSPYLNVIEKYWRQAKHCLLVSGYYPVFADMRRTMSECLRTSKIKLGMCVYLNRWIAFILKNF